MNETLKQFKARDWALLVVVTLAAVLGLLHILFGLRLVLAALFSATAAAWVQAIGSVVAILASVKLVLWQHELELARNQAASKHSDQSVERGVLWAMESTQKLLWEVKLWMNADKPHPGEIWDLYTKLEMHRKSWETRDIIALPKLELVHWVMDVRGLLSIIVPMAEEMKKFIEPQAGQGYGRTYLPKYITAFSDIVDQAKAAIGASGEPQVDK